MTETGSESLEISPKITENQNPTQDIPSPEAKLDSVENLNHTESKGNGWGGARENAGRPMGRKNTSTLIREAVEKELQQRVLGAAHKLIDSQMNLASGCQFLYRIDKSPITNSKGEVTGYKNEKPVLVTAPWEIEQYLEGVAEGDVEDDKDPGSAYYFLTTDKPDNRALDSLFDRVFGKAQQKVDLTSKGEKLPGVQQVEVSNIEQLASKLDELAKAEDYAAQSTTEGSSSSTENNAVVEGEPNKERAGQDDRVQEPPVSA